MKKTLLLAGALLALTAVTASAQGLNLSWGDCGTSGTLQRNFACNTNAGTANTMVGSVIVGGSDMNQLNGHEGVADMQTNQAALSPWWLIGGAGCRAASTVTGNFDFTANVNCLDIWAGGGFGGVNYVGPFGPPNRARFRTVWAVDPPVSITGTDEYYVLRLTFNNSKSTGLGSCAGCLDGACIVLNSIKMTQPLAANDDRTITNSADRQFVQWQGGGGLGGQCPGATPTKSATWGSVKSLYR